MEYGSAVASPVDAWKTVRRAEELGFTHAWFYDSQLLAPEIFISMALAAEHTSKIKLGLGILVPANRIAPSAANALATLNTLAPGRIICGLGTGFTARYTMGLQPLPLSDLREYLRILRLADPSASSLTPTAAGHGRSSWNRMRPNVCSWSSRPTRW